MQILRPTSSLSNEEPQEQNPRIYIYNTFLKK